MQNYLSLQMTWSYIWKILFPYIHTHTHICNLLENTKPIRTNTFSKFAGTKSTCKSLLHFYTLTKNQWNKTKKTIQLRKKHNYNKKNTLEEKFNQEGGRTLTNKKTLSKETESATKTWKDDLC